MNPDEIKQLGIKSSRLYWNYLNAQNINGRTEIQIFNITSVDEVFILKIAQKIFDTDSLIFRIIDQEYDTLQIKIVEYDEDQKQLIVRPEIEYKNLFVNLTSDKIKIIVDLKFLVKRVEEWYSLNGDKVKLPTKRSLLGVKDIHYISDEKPTKNQEEAIKLIFETPFSYIWGAPGTGKTQYVLAYSILHYIQKGKRVAIFAPTNNAIEQVLSGVLKMMAKYNTDIKKVIRLGNPSKKFAEKFSEVCETKGLMKHLAYLDKQIENRKKTIESRILSEKLTTVGFATHYFSEVDKFILKLKEKQNEIDAANRELTILLNEFNNIQSDIQVIGYKMEDLNRKFHSTFYKIKKSLNKESTKEEKEYLKLSIQFKQKNLKLSGLNVAIKQIKENCKNLKLESDIDKSIRMCFLRIKMAFSIFEDTSKIVSKLDLTNYIAIKEQLEASINKKKNQINEANTLGALYQLIDSDTLQQEIRREEAKRDHLKSQSTEERLKSVQVIALTLDHYIFRFKEERLDVDHIFVDEAGYSNIAKGLTLFVNDVPITFLGDHYQLPPVCQMDDNKIEIPENNDVFIWSQSAIFTENIFLKSKDEASCLYFKGLSYEMSFSLMKMNFLTETHRFGNELAEILDKYIYRNRGFSSVKQKDSIKICFINVPFFYPQPLKPNGKFLRVNTFEANEIIKRFQNNKGNKFSILSPYKDQVDKIGSALELIRNDERVLTVHRSQGREWETIILSVVDTNGKYFVDSLKSPGKFLINTAVSRAKKELIIVCNYDYWIKQEGQLIKALLEVATEIKLNS